MNPRQVGNKVCVYDWELRHVVFHSHPKRCLWEGSYLERQKTRVCGLHFLPSYWNACLSFSVISTFNFIYLIAFGIRDNTLLRLSFQFFETAGVANNDVNVHFTLSLTINIWHSKKILFQFFDLVVFAKATQLIFAACVNFPKWNKRLLTKFICNLFQRETADFSLWTCSMMRFFQSFRRRKIFHLLHL